MPRSRRRRRKQRKARARKPSHIFAKVVQHPGTKAQPFLRPALERGSQFLLDQVQKIAATGVKGFSAPRYDSSMDRAIKTAAFVAKAEAQKLAAVDTGTLRASINVQINGREATIGTNVAYARDVEFGTKPHVIRPVNKRLLSWPVRRRR